MRAPWDHTAQSTDIEELMRRAPGLTRREGLRIQQLGLTPDEEIGRGADLFDVTTFGADWAYTMDGSQIGELEYENFNAAGVKITFKGKSVVNGVYVWVAMMQYIDGYQQMLSGDVTVIK